jgi:hypothetical protein
LKQRDWLWARRQSWRTAQPLPLGLLAAIGVNEGSGEGAHDLAGVVAADLLEVDSDSLEPLPYSAHLDFATAFLHFTVIVFNAASVAVAAVAARGSHDESPVDAKVNRDNDVADSVAEQGANQLYALSDYLRATKEGVYSPTLRFWLLPPLAIGLVTPAAVLWKCQPIVCCPLWPTALSPAASIAWRWVEHCREES